MNLENRIEYTKNGFSYIKVTPLENIKWGGYCICNSCNNQILYDDMYLVYILGDVYCKECFDKWASRKTTLTDEELECDLKYQTQEHIDWYKYHLERGENNE